MGKPRSGAGGGGVWWGKAADEPAHEHARGDEFYGSLILFEKQGKVWDSRSSSLRACGLGYTLSIFADGKFSFALGAG
jgi:hypothetical protein